MRLIDADEAIINFGFEWDDISPTRDEFVEFIKKQPTIEAEPVVRCKGCKYLVNATVNSKGFLICHVTDMKITSEDFCSYGERKKDK